MRNMKENGREQGLTDKDVVTKFAKERRCDSITEQCCELDLGAREGR